MTSAAVKRRVLFVCTQNRVRSLTAEHLYRPRPDLEVRSAGIAENAGVPLTRELFEWADHVFVFSKGQEKIVKERYRDSFDSKPVVCLRLPDRFQYKGADLVMALREKLGPYLGTPDSTELPSTKQSWQPVAAPPRAENALVRRARSGQRPNTVWSALCSFGLAIMGIAPQIVRNEQTLTTEPGI
jgi:predicted protein tyrosine phosphatase